jgi:hypothetical protein
MRRLIAAAVITVASVSLAAPAFAGEINGQGLPVGGEGLGAAHAHSICAFSGLQDGDGLGFPGPGGAPPQNWGHIPKDQRGVGENVPPGTSCNGHTGFLAQGGPTP